MRTNPRRKGEEGKEEVALPERIAPEVEMHALPSLPSRTTRPASPSRITRPTSPSRTSQAKPRHCPGRVTPMQPPNPANSRRHRLPQQPPSPPRLASRLRRELFLFLRGGVFFPGGVREQTGRNG
jgi:hypothetical protein